MLDMLPEWFRIFFMSMIPWFESRYVIPIAIDLGWEWWQAFPIAVAGNMLPIPFILLFFNIALILSQFYCIKPKLNILKQTKECLRHNNMKEERSHYCSKTQSEESTTPERVE